MLLKADRVYLDQLVHFSHMGRPVTAIGLYDAGVNCDHTGALVHKNIELLSVEEAIKKATECNTGSRVQGVVVAKLAAEFIAGIEDLGAFCYAVKNRDKESIFKRYSLSESEHGQFLKDIVENSEANLNLSVILNIPTINELNGKILVDLYEGLEKSYKQVARQIKAAAALYRMMGSRGEGIPDPKNVVYVVHETVDAHKPKHKNGGIMVKTYNKIKHRFLVFEDIEPLLKAIEEQDIGLGIGFTTLSRLPKDVMDMYLITMGIANCMAEIAGILIILEDNGIHL